MRLSRDKLSLLKSMRYLDAIESNPKSIVIDVKLLENGKQLRREVEKQWSKDEHQTSADFKETPISEFGNLNLTVNQRLRFVYTNEFRKNMQLLNKNPKMNFIKTVCNEKTVHTSEDYPIKYTDKNGENSRLLITDSFYHSAFGLEKLYNIQRERKIWWMRFSADPSRYYLEPYDIGNKQSEAIANIANAQSITIKSHLPFGDIGVEQITMVPLNQASLQDEHEFEIYDERTKKKQLPTVIRSVINLDIATCALIFDAAANTKRESTLFLNRKLTPFQCFVTYINEAECDSDINDLMDLCAHISDEIRRAGLRLLNMNDYVGDRNLSQNQFELADKLGIPYTILVNSHSLNSGLLELRNRDTALNEIIHISDIPDYLLHIFHVN